MHPLGCHSSHRLRIKSTAALVDGAGDGEGAGDGAGAVDGAFTVAVEPADAAERRTVDAAGTAPAPVGSVVGAPVIVVPAVVITGPVLPLSLSGVASLVLGGGGGMSRAGPVVGSRFGVPEASVVAALASELEGVVLCPFSEGPDTAAATRTPPSDITRSNPAHGSHGGTKRLCPGMMAVGRSRRERSGGADPKRAEGFERPFSRW